MIGVLESQGVIIRHCQVWHRWGIAVPGEQIRIFRIEDCHVFGASEGIFSAHGGHVTASTNYVHDSTKYGIFRCTGSDHIVENNYAAWTGREGAGTCGSGPRHRYRNNVILHTGWTAIKVEGACDDSVVEGNLLVDTH